MDRRTSLATLLGKKQVVYSPPTNTSLDEYTGAWSKEQAAHLLRRTMYGPNRTQINETIAAGMASTVDLLLQDDLPLPSPPVNYAFEGDSNVAVGETWIDKPYLLGENATAHRNRSLASWTMNLLYREGVSIREKMVLFWHNHFGISDVNDPIFKYKTSQLLRTHALGNFREIIKQMTVDPSMLRFLNGNQNRKEAPNENYARELLELFTIGKGPQIAPGDYSNYTEDDIIEIAKVLTGWRDRGFRTADPDQEIFSEFIPARHDETTKALSAHFDNATIANMGENEYSHLIDVIFQQDEVARFISRKLYRWFIYYDIDAAAEELVIEPMAELLIANDYEIKPVLSALFRSEHFYDILNVGPMIKNPIDFLMSALKVPMVELPDAPLATFYEVPYQIYNLSLGMEMNYYSPPSVAGWKAYYQEPGYYRIWINSTTLQFRTQITDGLSTIGFTIDDFVIRIDSLNILNGLSNPGDPNIVITEITDILFTQPITDSQIAALKQILIPGLPDFEWTVAYNEYLAEPDNPDVANPIIVKMSLLFRALLAMPEFYLM